MGMQRGSPGGAGRTRRLTPLFSPLNCRLFFPKHSTATTAYETHLSALEAHPETPVWLPGADEDQERPRHSLAAPPAWPQAPPAQGRRSPLRPAHQGLIGFRISDFGISIEGQRRRPGVPLNLKPETIHLNFPKSARLQRAAEFARLKREGVSFHGKFMVLSVLESQPDTALRFGVITSRRVGGAVARNRVRRRLREIVRADRPAICAGRWCVIVARHAAATAAFDALRAEWRRLAARSGLLPTND